jgi:hypothetical protein
MMMMIMMMMTFIILYYILLYYIIFSDFDDDDDGDGDGDDDDDDDDDDGDDFSHRNYGKIGPFTCTCEQMYHHTFWSQFIECSGNTCFFYIENLSTLVSSF